MVKNRIRGSGTSLTWLPFLLLLHCALEQPTYISPQFRLLPGKMEIIVFLGLWGLGRM